MLRCCVLIFFLAVNAWAQVPIGATKSEVIDKLGWPKSTSGSAQREILNYPEFTIYMEEGKVLNLRPKPVDPTKRSKNAPQAKPMEVSPKAVQEVPTQNRPTPPAERPAAMQPVSNKQPPKPAPAAVERSRTITQRPPPETIQSMVFRTLGPWALLFGVLLALKLIFGKKLEQKSLEMRDEMLRNMNEPERRALGLPPRSRAEPASAPTAWSLQLLKAIEWHRFEHLVAAYERELGNDAELTDFGPDGGIDIRVFEKGSRTPKRIIQCKAFNNQLVDVKLVRELMGVMAHEKASQGAFYTTSEFTPPALELGRGHLDIELVDGRIFLNRISRLIPEAQARLIAVATEGDYTTPTCASCGVKMILKTAGKGRREGSNFWGCRNYPRCQQIINIAKSS